LRGRAFAGYAASDKLIYDGKIDAMASALEKMYPIILEQFEKYLDTEEMLQLKKKGPRIRALKVTSAAAAHETAWPRSGAEGYNQHSP